MFVVSIPFAFVSGAIFLFIKLKGVSGESAMGYLNIPYAGIFFIIVTGIFIGVISVLIVNDNRIINAMKVLLIILLILLLLDIVLLINCTPSGCRNVDALKNKALEENNPKVCNERKFWVDPYEDFEIEPKSVFQLYSDPYPSTSVKSDCLFGYLLVKREDAKLCIEVIGPGKSTCIYNVIEAHPEPEKCDALKGLDPNTNNLEFYNSAYSICYSALARFLSDEKYCEKVDQNGRENRNDCYINIAVYKKNESICEKLRPEPLYPQNDGLGKPDNPKTKEYCLEYVKGFK